MTSREKILAAVKTSQPGFSELPDISHLSNHQSFSGDANSAASGTSGLVERFISSIQAIGGHAKAVNNYEEIKEAVKYQFADAKRVVTTFNELKDNAEVYCEGDTIHSPEEIDVAILSAHFGVAENGAVWISENIMCDRALPFICQHLIAIIHADTIVPDMHAAYNKISSTDYGFAIFIAGPSKTADIEQSLVLGAHGPVSMTVFVLK